MNDSSNDDAEDDEQGPEIPRAPRAAAGKGTTSPGESQRKKLELIAIGKAKGFLTYDEVNAQMRQGTAPSKQMDDWLSAFSREGIELVDSASNPKVTTGAGEADSEDEEERRGDARRKKRKRTPTAIPRPTTRCACTCARWGRSRC